MFGLSNFIITEFLLIFYSLVTNVLYSYKMQALLAKDQEKDAVISKQASEIDTLRQQNEEMQRKIDMILAKLK